MNTTLASNNNSFATSLQDLISYPTTGIFSKVLVKDNDCQYKLLSLAAGKKIDEHTSAHNAVIIVVEGSGNISLDGKDFNLVPGLFVFISANTIHAVQAQENLSFILALSKQSLDAVTSLTPQEIRDQFKVENPAHLVYLSIGDRGW